MKPSSLPGLASMIALGACAAGAVAAPPEPAVLTARLVDVTPVKTNPYASLAKQSRKPMAGMHPGPLRPLARPARSRAANGVAAPEPADRPNVAAAIVYPWIEGRLYPLRTAPERVSDIALQPGETLISVAAGDTARWVIGDTSSGSPAGRRTHVLVKPLSAGLATNLLIATDRRVYHLELESTPNAAMAGISWTYPDDALLALKSPSQAAGESAAAADVTVDALNFNYRIEGDNTAWRPLRAFDDGHQMFIEFPPTLPQGEAPPLFVRGEEGRAELVNYRLRGHYYVVDRLFSAAELRLGGKRQQVVRIVRDDPPPRRPA